MAASIRNEQASKSFFIYVVDQNTGKLKRTAIPCDLQVGLKNSPAELQVHGRLSVSSDAYVVTSGTHGVVYVDPNDTIVNVSVDVVPSNGRVSVMLPSNPRDGQLVIIKDASGTGGSTPLDVVPDNSYHIDDALSSSISVAYGTLGVYWYNNQWRTLFSLGTTVTGSSGGSSDGADRAASYLVISNTSSLPNERRLVAGANISISDGGAGGALTISATGGGSGGGGDPGASYVVIGLTSSLSNERRLAAGSGISIVDNGANNTVVISADAVTSGADVSASYITIGNTGSLPNERHLTVSTGLTLNDGGAGSAVSVGINDGVIATLTGSTFSGPVVAQGGLSGSLQQLANGLSYLVGVGSVTVTSQSNGQIIISGSGGSGGGGGGGSSSTTIVTASYRRYARHHDNAYDPVALWQLSGNLLDSGPHAYTLSAVNTERYALAAPGLLGAWFDGTQRLQTTVAPANLLLTGAMTFEAIVCVGRQNSSNQYIGGIGGTGDNYATNYLWSAFLGSNSNSLSYFAESGSAGTNIQYDTTSSISVGVPTHVAMVRGDDYQVTFYVNGERVAPPSTGLLNPSFSTLNGRAFLGDNESSTGKFLGTIASVKVMSSALSEAQIRREFEYTLGPLYGVLNNETADVSASYIVVGATGSLPNERAVAAGTGIRFTDGGSGGNFTIGVNDSVIATLSGSTFTGNVHVSGTLTVGSGTVGITSNDVRFGPSDIRIERSGSHLKLYDQNNVSGATLSSMALATGSCVITVTTGSVTANLSTTGTIDWFTPAGSAAQNYRAVSSGYSKAQGGWIHQSFDFFRLGSYFTQASDHTVTSNADDTTGAAVSTTTDVGVQLAAGTNIGYRFRVPASRTSKTLRIYGSIWSSQVRISVRASDGSFTTTTETRDTGAAAGYYLTWTITYNTARDGEEALVEVRQLVNNGSTPNMKIMAMTLSGST